MAILGVTSQKGRLFCPGDPASDLRLHLAQALELAPKSAPIVIMIHGYKYHPGHPNSNPHKLLFSHSNTQSTKLTSWPLGLGFEKMTTKDGLAIGFAWEGLPRKDIRPKPMLSSFAHVYKQANRAGGHLARILKWIHVLAPGRPVDLIAHSLGARVAFSGLSRLSTRNVDRVILMGGAEYASSLDRYFRHIDRDSDLEVFNITTRQNSFVDFLFECFAPRSNPSDFAIGKGYVGPTSNWLNLNLDDTATLNMLATRGIGISRARKLKLVDHWGFYARAGVLRFYQQLLRHRTSWRMEDLRQELIWAQLPEDQDPLSIKPISP